MSQFAKFFLLLFWISSCQSEANVKKAELNVDKLQNKTVNSNGETILDRIKTPIGYERIKLNSISFGHYLRNFPLKEDGTAVKLFDGSLKPNQSAHIAVLDIDVGKGDLQQCADAVMRLRAEYLYSNNQAEKIAFNFTNGFVADFRTWSAGNRILVSGNRVSWIKESSSSGSYNSFRKYMNMVFAYAGTASLVKELNAKSLQSIEVGDVLIKGGHPGHAVLVMDVAINNETGDKVFLLSQSYMPAQDIHLLKNPYNDDLNPWYSVAECEDEVKTPEWTFNKNQIRSF